ncbi:MAG TPA: GNAT family N-acetyltransferase [Streptosporangiaceae bacterium]|jgi:predicted acetyltransferase
MPELIAPTVSWHAAWLEAHDEWGPGFHEDGFGVRPSDEVRSPAGFAAWVARLTDQSDPARPVETGHVHCTYRWIVEDGQVLGGIALRHEFSDYVRWAGHVGYGIRPSARRRGLATWALGRMLDEARTLGIDRVLVVCLAGNVASAKTIERQGGAFERIQDTEHGRVRRYWIKLGEPSAAQEAAARTSRAARAPEASAPWIEPVER